MLHITVDGTPAVIKDNSSFDFVSENPMFSDADEYSMSISFPLRNCPENIAVFGHLNRHGSRISSRIYDLHIIAGSNSFHGSGVVTGISDVECKLQFLGSRSAENYYSDLDQVFINTLDLGGVPEEFWLARNVSVKTAWAGHSGGMDMVAIPWVNEGSGNIQNDTKLRDPDESTGTVPVDSQKWVPGADQVWKDPEDAEDLEDYQQGLSWFPYLIDIAAKICEAIGFEADFSAWKNSKWNELLLCHAVPDTWDHYWATLMPHWSVIEFFRNLEPLIEGVFDIDYRNRRIVFSSYASALDSSRIVELKEVIDEFSAEVFDKDEECKMISHRYIGYSVPDSKVGKAYSCQWLVRDFISGGNITDYDTAEDLAKDALSRNWRKYSSFGHRAPGSPEYAWYIAQDDRYLTYRVVMGKRIIFAGTPLEKTVDMLINTPLLLNNLGPRRVPADRHDAESLDLSLEIVPAVIDDTDERRMLFIPLGEYEKGSAEPIYDSDETEIGGEIYDSVAMQLLEEGEDDGSKAYFSNMSVGFYPGASECSRGGNEIYPIVDNLEFDQFWQPWRPENPEYTLSLQDRAGKFAGIPEIDGLVRHEFSFLADTLPDVRSIFLIRGNLYVCEKLTATMSGSGMSRKIKGTFWRIVSQDSL